jgi:hypothetical protein
MNDPKLDERIAGLVRSVELDVPDGLDERVRTAARSLPPKPRPASRAGRRWLWPVLVPSAAFALAAALLILPALRRPAAPPISEIRTEFELADKNIKIIFFQKSDFKFPKEN